jgi:hypothetical protein
MAKELLWLSMKLPALNELLLYHNKQVVDYFCHHHPEFSLPQSQQLFTDLLGWMWLTVYRKTSERHTYLFGPLLDMDSLWHAFILHTRDYQLFCERYFGNYFHHDIEPIGHEHELTPDQMANFLQDCFEFLGDDWVERYFAPALT